MSVVEERLAQNHAEFQDLLDRMEKAIEGDDPDAAIEFARTAATIAWLKGCGIFASPRLEALVARVGRTLPQAGPTRRRSSGPRRVLTIMSAGYAVGGHTRLACRWMALDTCSSHTLVTTRQDGVPLPRVVEELVENGTIRLETLDRGSSMERAASLRRLLSEADLAVLHTHPNDPLPVVALAGMESPPPVLFEDHASHVFWLGASVSNLVVSLCESAARVTVARRGVPRSHIGWTPIPLDLTNLGPSPDIDIRARYGVPHDAPLLMSCGSAYKFVPIDGVSTAALLAPLLDERPDVHVLLVGPSSEPVGTSLAADHPGRVHLAGNIARQDELHAAYAACDIYLDVAPFPSNTALCEAAALGKPVLKFAPQAWTDCGFTIDLDAIPPPLYVSHDADDYRQKLRTLIDSPALRARRGQLVGDMLRLCHSDSLFQNQIEALYRELLRGVQQLRQPDTRLVGVTSGGAWLAERLQKDLGLGGEPGVISSAMHRDDYASRGLAATAQTKLDFDVNGAHILLLDDVLYTGRTIRAVLNELFDYGRPAAVALAVLVDRGGRELPVQADFAAARVTLPADQALALARDPAGLFTFELEHVS